MAGFTANITLDPASIRAIARFEDWELRLFPLMMEAERQNVADIKRLAQNEMWAGFQNPTGALENNFGTYVYGPYEAEVENDMPYAVRRNYGFSGKTDALGRYYANDPGILWAENAVDLAIPHVEANVTAAFNAVIAGI